MISDLRPEPRARLISPRLAHPEQAAEFRMEVSNEARRSAVRVMRYDHFRRRLVDGNGCSEFQH